MVTQYRKGSDGSTADTDLNPSPNIWADCPWMDIKQGITPGTIFMDHFLNQDDIATSGTTVGNWYYTDVDDAYDAVQTADVMGGILRLTCDADDNDEVHIETGDNKNGQWEFNAAGSSPKDLWAECRVSFAQVVTQSAFIGFCEFGQAANGGLADGGTCLGDVDFAGFQVLEADPNMLDAHTQVSGVAGADAVADAQEFEVDTYYKLGMKFVADENRLYFYVNGVRKGSVLTSATAFPSGEEMAWHFGLKNNSASADMYLDIDWVRIAQRL